MFVAKVTGSLVSTHKVDAMVGSKLLVVEPYRLDAKALFHSLMPRITARSVHVKDLAMNFLV